MGSVAPSLARVCGIFTLLTVGCGGSPPPPADTSPPHPDVTAPAPAGPSPDAPPPAPSAATNVPASTPAVAAPGTDTQLARGRELYAKDCADCHGANGRGGKSPALVGLAGGALPLAPTKRAKYRKQSFKTAADVRDFMVKTMPPTAPESLGTDDAHALLAFLLHENGVSWGSQPLDASRAQQLEIPRP